MIPPPTFTRPGLEDLVSGYTGAGDLPLEWLTFLHLKRPQNHLHSLGTVRRAAKRALDIVAALLALLALAPVAILIAILVRCTSPGPVIFRQVRVGLNLRWRPDRRKAPRVPAGAEGEGPPVAVLDGSGPGAGQGGQGTSSRAAPVRTAGDRRRNPAYGRPFTIYKFRTMVADAERDGARLATPNDNRVTPLGRFLRRTRLDEIPQFVNVLRGEMSLVGPRPERPEFIEELARVVPGYLGRLGLKPGLTGLAQVLNGYDDGLESVRKKVALDLLYLQNCCALNDLKIVLRTIGVVLTGRGAR